MKRKMSVPYEQGPTGRKLHVKRPIFLPEGSVFFFCRSQMGFIYNHQHNHTCLPFRSCIIYIESTGPGHGFHGEKSPSAQLRARRKSSRHFSDASSKSKKTLAAGDAHLPSKRLRLTPVRRGASSVLSGHHDPLCTRLLPLKRPQQEIWLTSSNRSQGGRPNLQPSLLG